MKRLIAAASLAVFAAPALSLDIGKPYEETLDRDRALPNVAPVQASPVVYPFGGSAPYERVARDRALPDLRIAGERTQFAATAGATRTDAVNGTEPRPAVSPFARQHDFIAPAP